MALLPPPGRRPLQSQLVRINEKHWLARDLIFAHSGYIPFLLGRPSPEQTPVAAFRRLGLLGTHHPILREAQGWVPDATNSEEYLLPVDAVFLPLTLSAWWHGTVASVTNPILSVKRTGANVGGVVLGRNSAETVQASSIATNGNISSAIATGGWASGRWQHGAAVFKTGGVREAYADGGNFATQSFIRALPTDAKVIGIGISPGGAAYQGVAQAHIDAIVLPVVLARALDAGEVARLHEEQRSNPWALFTERKIWVPVSAGTTATISPTGLASAEAFGTAAISFRAAVAPTGIASAEVFGTATITRSGVAAVSPAGIASAEAFGTAAISFRAAVAPTGITSAEAFGTATITRSVVAAVSPAGVASAEAFGTAAISFRAAVAPTGIASEEVFGSATFARDGAAPPPARGWRNLAVYVGLRL